MATVRIPNSCAVRKTRIAISLRFATSNLWMGRGVFAAGSAMVVGLDEWSRLNSRIAQQLTERVAHSHGAPGIGVIIGKVAKGSQEESKCKIQNETVLSNPFPERGFFGR